MSPAEINPVCVGIRRFGETECLDPDVPRLVAELGKCVLCDTCANRLEEQAFTDQLTGLGNRFESEQHFHRLEHEGTPMVIIQGDISKFKPVNDELGQSTGDVVLKYIANRLQSQLRSLEDSVLIRQGGDEFTVIAALVRQPTDGEETDHRTVIVPTDEREAAAEAITRRMRSTLSEDAALNEYRSKMGNPNGLLLQKLGYTIYDPLAEPGKKLEELQKRADPKGRAAKSEPRAKHTHFNQQFNAQLEAGLAAQDQDTTK